MKKPKIEPLAKLVRETRLENWEVWIGDFLINAYYDKGTAMTNAKNINATADAWAKRNYGSFLPAEKCLPKQFGKWKVVVGKWKVVKPKKKSRKK